MIRPLAILGALCLFSISHLSAQTSPSNEELLKEIRAIRQELADIKRLLSTQRPAAAPDVLPTTPINITNQPLKGDRNAKVVMIEYSDYQCPFCGKFVRETYPQIQRDYINTGKVKHVFRDYPLDFHKQAFKAAEAAHCAWEQGKFWEMHDRLFANQNALTPPDLAKHAQALGLNRSAFQNCLDTARTAADIRKGMADGASVGASGTPTFLLGRLNADGTVKVSRKLVGAKPYAEFKTAIDSVLASR